VNPPPDPAGFAASSNLQPWSGRVWRCHHRSRAAVNADGSLGGIGGRFNAGVDSGVKPPFRALYASIESAAALLEVVRHLGYQSADRRDVVALDDIAMRVLTQIDVELKRVLDWRRESVLRENLRHVSYRETQQLAAAAFNRNAEGILVPSATGIDANLVVFVDNLDHSSRIDVIRQIDDLQPIIASIARGVP
jgi:RES domain-containing protein